MELMKTMPLAGYEAAGSGSYLVFTVCGACKSSFFYPYRAKQIGACNGQLVALRI